MWRENRIGGKMEKLNNKYIFIILAFLIAIICLLFFLFSGDIKENVYPIFFIVLSFFVFLGEIFLYSNIKVKLDKVLFYSGSIVLNILYIILAIFFSCFYKVFSSVEQYIITNVIILLLNLLGFVIVYNVSKYKGE